MRLQSLIAFLFVIALCQPIVWAQENDILDFRVISDLPDELVVEVEYVYSGNMGNKIGISAGVSGEQNYKIGVSPAWVYKGRHVAKINLGAIEKRASGAFTTRDLKFYMYDQSSGRKVSMVKRFSYEKNWLSDRSAIRKGPLSKPSKRPLEFKRLAYRVNGYSKKAGGSFRATIQFASKYHAKLQMNQSGQGGDWIDMNVETVSNRNIRMYAKLPSGNSMEWDVAFSNDMNSLNGHVVMHSSFKNSFEVTGDRVE